MEQSRFEMWRFPLAIAGACVLVNIYNVNIYNQHTKRSEYAEKFSLQEETIRSQDKLIELLEERIELFKHLKESQTESLENMFPAFEISETRTLTARERTDLEELLVVDIPKEEAVERGWNNLCMINYYSERGEDVEEMRSGSCIFLTPSLVLTNYHIIKKDYEKELHGFDQLVIPYDKENFHSSSFTVVAISPFYDLALLRIYPPHSTIKPVPIKHVREPQENEEFTYMTYHDFDDVVSGEEYGAAEEGKLTFEDIVTYIGLGKNILLFPGLTMTPQLDKGYSGSPVLQNGAIIGLVAQLNESNATTFVTPHVRDFVQRVVDYSAVLASEDR